MDVLHCPNSFSCFFDPNSPNSHPGMNNHRTTCLVAIFAFLVIIPPVATLNFSLTSFTPNDVVIQGSATLTGDSIRLTRSDSTSSIGRATYAKPLQLWDKPSGNLTDFTTHFSFVLDSDNRSTYGDGMAFFLAPVGSQMPDNIGGSLGLTTNDQLFNSTRNPFVAVEFDTFENYFDPVGDHVGININSMISETNTTWWSSIRDGKKNDAWISYDSHSRNLTVVFTGFIENTTILQSLSYIIDLREFLPEQVIFGFTAATGSLTELHEINSWNFSSTLQIGQNTTDPGVFTPAPVPGLGLPTKGKSKTGLVIGLIVGGSVLVAGFGLFLFAFRKRRGRRDYEGDAAFEIPEFEGGTGPKKFKYANLARATSNFAEDEKLGEGGFGGVYKGYLSELNAYIAVKRVSKGSSQGVKEYASEVKIISRLRHRNLVQLIGWCHERSELLLVYEFMSNGSLDYHLFKGKSLLTWEMRYKIAQGIGSALLYLHEEWEQCVVHRDIKSSNVMLDSTFNAKLGDFGLARLVDHEKGSQTTILAGTMGYMAPECVITGKASKETDVYSFGIVALEIACGRKPINPKAEEGLVNLVEWVWSLYGAGRLFEAVDPKLSLDYNEQEIENLMIVGLWCAHPDSNSRPSIRQASRVLNFEGALPTLPSSMPVATYGTPLVNTAASSSTSAIVSRSSQIQSSIYSTDSSKFSTSSRASSPSVSLLHTR